MNTKSLKKQFKHYKLLEKEAEKFGVVKTKSQDAIEKKIEMLQKFIGKETEKLQRKLELSKNRKGLTRKQKRENKWEADYYKQNRNDHVLLYDLLEIFSFSTDLIKMIHGYCCDLSPLVTLQNYIPNIIFECIHCKSLDLNRYMTTHPVERDSCQYCFRRISGLLVSSKHEEYPEEPDEECQTFGRMMCQSCLNDAGYTLHDITKCVINNCKECLQSKRYNYQALTNMSYHEHNDLVTLDSLLCPISFVFPSLDEFHHTIKLFYPEPDKFLRNFGGAHFKKRPNCRHCKKWRPECQVCAVAHYDNQNFPYIIHTEDVTVCHSKQCYGWFFMSEELMEKYKVQMWTTAFFGILTKWNPDICKCNRY